MKKCVVAIAGLLWLFSFPAFGQSSAKKGSSGGLVKEAAVLFHIEDFVSPAAPYDDGFQTGAGMKLLFSDTIAARVLLALVVEPDRYTDESTTTFGLSAAGEYRFSTGKAVPYLGVIAGMQVLAEPEETFLDYFGGIMGGVEVRLLDHLALYAEYHALVTSTIDGVGFALGDRALLGFAIYF